MADENVTSDLALFLAVKADEDEKAKIILIESRSSDLLALENLIYNMLVCTRREEISKLPLLGIAILSLLLFSSDIEMLLGGNNNSRRKQ